jgi:TRAP-type mannitol/chloroaromatic compound transport system substrate-binding protein
MLPCRAARSIVFAFAFAMALQWTAQVRAHGVTLKIHHFLSPDSPFHVQFLVPWKEKLEKDSDGHLRIQVYPAMGLGGNPPQLYDQAKDRTVDIVWAAVGYETWRFPAFEVFNLPFVTQSAQSSSRALWRYVQKHNLARTEFAGVRVLAVGVFPAGPSDAEATLHKGDANPELPHLFVLVMNADAYKSLPDELKAVINANSGAETSASLGKMFDDSVAGRPPSANGESSARAAEFELTQQRAAGVVEKRIQELNRRGLDGGQLVESARALLAEYDAAK